MMKRPEARFSSIPALTRFSRTRSASSGLSKRSHGFTSSLLTCTLALLLLLPAFGLIGCAGTESPDTDNGAFLDHAELSDLEPAPSKSDKADGVASSFQHNNVMSDEFFSDHTMMDADAVQHFLENTPYGKRSWLADETIGGQRAADAIASAAFEFRINPLLLLARLQVEAGLVSKSVRPSQSRIDRAMGCGCFDGSACIGRYLGFDKQLNCAANTLRTRFGDSEAGTFKWRKGHGHKTLDGLWITPANHATASLYAYTPWVLQGRGGTWLVWNITERYEDWILENGFTAGGGSPWVGSPCTTNADCDFQNGGIQGSCLIRGDDEADGPGDTDEQDAGDGESAEPLGFCTLPCEGYCPDQTGHPTTFCVALPAEDGGRCVSKAEGRNETCEEVQGTSVVWASRFVGESGAPEANGKVCLP